MRANYSIAIQRITRTSFMISGDGFSEHYRWVAVTEHPEVIKVHINLAVYAPDFETAVGVAIGHFMQRLPKENQCSQS